MDDQCKRMMLLGRQAPPRELDLRLEPRTHVSPHHAPVADVVYRVEKHLAIQSPERSQEPSAPFQQSLDRAPAEQDKLHESKKTVKLRAAKAHKELRMVTLQWQQDLQTKKNNFVKRREYARKVALSNRMKSCKASEAGDSSSSSDDDSEGSCAWKHVQQPGDPIHAEYRCQSSPSASPCRTRIDPMVIQAGPHNSITTGLQVMRDADTKSHQWISLQIGKQMPLQGAPKAALEVGWVQPTMQAGGGESSRDMPVPPPPHVTPQVQAWHTQEHVYHGACRPPLASGAYQPTPSKPDALTLTQHQRSCQDGRPNSRMTRVLHSKLDTLDNRSHQSQAWRSLLRHCAPGIPSQARQIPDGTESHKAPAVVKLAEDMACAPMTAHLDRVAGGGCGFPEVQSPSRLQCSGAIQDIAKTPVHGQLPSWNSGLHGSQNMHNNAQFPPARSTVSASVSDTRGKRLEGRLTAAMLARIEEKAKQMNLHLPQLCACHTLSVLNPAYPLHCACNCPFYKNEGFFFEQLHCLLQAFAIAVW